MKKINTIMESEITGVIEKANFRGYHSDSTAEFNKINKNTIDNGNTLGAFVFKIKENRNYLIIFLIGGLIQFFIFKVLYPFPDFISDSYSYIDTNLYHMKVNLWPIGYSKYLELIHRITSSDTTLIFSQFIILESALLYFFYSAIYFYNLSRKNTNILFAFLFFNPLFLYLANCVLSDAIFCAISLVIVTRYLWMLNRPKTSFIITQALLIGLAFTFRYTAIYYPILGMIAFLLSNQSALKKVAGITAPLLLIIPFILYTQQKTKVITGTAQFSVFGGWQLANNALYMYDHIKVDSNQLPPGTLELDRLARSYFENVPPQYRVLEAIPGTFFIKVRNAILKPYVAQRFAITNAPDQFLAWGKVSPIYNAYGKYLIQHYPLAFVKYYLWLNVQNYFIPYLEKFDSYNLEMDEILPSAKAWFKYKDSTVTSVPSSEFQRHIFFFFPPFFMMLNLYFVGCLIYLLASGKLRHQPRVMYHGILLVGSFLLINFCFSVFATPVVLRYQIITMILLFTFSLYMTEKLENTDPKKSI